MIFKRRKMKKIERDVVLTEKILDSGIIRPRKIKFSPEEIKTMDFQSFRIHSEMFLRTVNLFKYFPNKMNESENINYSKEALKNGTIFVNKFSNFNDPFDGSIPIDYQDYLVQSLNMLFDFINLERTSLGGSVTILIAEIANDISRRYSNGESLEKIFQLDCVEISDRKIRGYFVLAIKQFARGKILYYEYIQKAIIKAIHNRYLEYENIIKKSLASCFSMTETNPPMWSHYADNHKGFCIEYDLSVIDLKNEESEYIEIATDLYPVIYSLDREDFTKDVIRGLDDLRSDENLWKFLKYVVLSKSDLWEYENEWRYIISENQLKNKNQVINFLPIKQVILGCRMEKNERESIIRICKEYNRKFICYKMHPLTYAFRECGIESECMKAGRCLK